MTKQNWTPDETQYPDITIELDFTLEEAIFLKLICGNISGDPNKTLRKFADPIWKCLEEYPALPSCTNDPGNLYNNITHSLPDLFIKEENIEQFNKLVDRAAKAYTNG